MWLKNGEGGSLLTCLKEELGKYRGITLLSDIGKVFSKILTRQGKACMKVRQVLEAAECVDNVYTLNEGILDKPFLLDVQKAYILCGMLHCGLSCGI